MLANRFYLMVSFKIKYSQNQNDVANVVYMSDEEIQRYFNSKPVKSKILSIETRVIRLKCSPRNFALFYLRQGWSRILHFLIRLVRFGRNKIDSSYKSFE